MQAQHTTDSEYLSRAKHLQPTATKNTLTFKMQLGKTFNKLYNSVKKKYKKFYLYALKGTEISPSRPPAQLTFSLTYRNFECNGKMKF
jgi:hypothetical protein